LLDVRTWPQTPHASSRRKASRVPSCRRLSSVPRDLIIHRSEVRVFPGPHRTPAQAGFPKRREVRLAATAPSNGGR
jgi:hypothetical protein